MTTPEIVSDSSSQDESGRPQSWGDIAVSMVGSIANLPNIAGASWPSCAARIPTIRTRRSPGVCWRSMTS